MLHGAGRFVLCRLEPGLFTDFLPALLYDQLDWGVAVEVQRLSAFDVLPDPDVWPARRRSWCRQ